MKPKKVQQSIVTGYLRRKIVDDWEWLFRENDSAECNHKYRGWEKDIGDNTH